MDTQFKAGDVVELKSGGPKMTVNKTGQTFGGAFVVWCDWFDGKKMESKTFPSESLKLSEDPK